MAASNPRIGQTFQQAGISLLAPAEGLRLLQRVLQCSCSAPVLAAHVQWPQLLSRQQALPAIFSEVAALGQSSQQHSRLLAAQSTLQQQVQQPAAVTQTQPRTPAADARQLLKQTLHQMLGHDIAEDEVSRPSADACCMSLGLLHGGQGHVSMRCQTVVLLHHLRFPPIADGECHAALDGGRH